MKILIILAVSMFSVHCENWISTLLDDMTKKTQEVQQYMADQETQFLETVTNQTNQMQNFITTQQKNVEEGIKTYNEGIKQIDNKVFSYLKDTDERLEKDFQRYMHFKVTPMTVLNAIPRMTNELELLSLPEAELSAPGMIASHGYACESHTVLTDDGYILTVHRIPRGLRDSSDMTPSKTVLLQHGIFASSADWVFAGPERSLAYLLADAGYDVWLANVRGNRYSREHATLRTDSTRYWDYSWHEIAQHDLPAIIDYMHRTKGAGVKINYIGHSMGTTILFAMLATRPEYNNRLHAGFALAPVVYMSDIRSSFKMFATYGSDLGYVATLLGAKEFMPRQAGRGWLGSDACNMDNLDIGVCEQFIFMLCGFDEEQLDRSMLPVFLAHIGSGTSTKTVVHFAQEISSGGRFQQFNYGPIDNMEQYGTETPPEYSLENVTLPIALFSSKNDLLSSETDVMRLFHNLRHNKEHYIVPFEKFNHLDFLWAKDVSELLHKKLLEVLNRLNP